jgi:hypothetical protein
MKPGPSPNIPAAINRRLFAQKVTSAAALLLLPSTDLTAQPKLDSKQTEKPENLSTADWNEVQARHQNLLRVYGDRLTADQKVRSLHILTTHQHMLASIRSFSVQNSDPSACTLRIGV